MIEGIGNDLLYGGDCLDYLRSQLKKEMDFAPRVGLIKTVLDKGHKILLKPVQLKPYLRHVIISRLLKKYVNINSWSNF